MADEFDLKPTSRGEEFLDVILRSLGGETPDIPQPAWRYEEYLAAIANAIQNGGGGGGSGGGVLVATMDMQTMTLDKTWKEMFDSAFCVIKFASDSQVSTLVPHTIKVQSGKYDVMATSNGGQAELFRTDSENGYPVYYHDS